ncbi:hypothetical protein F5Y14DRAFT_414082 [Nemania sp. NC0429]|nr:hypothetical protein F5Y14DRAFT_414082 [Nemania sp. NC0429]
MSSSFWLYTNCIYFVLPACMLVPASVVYFTRGSAPLLVLRLAHPVRYWKFIAEVTDLPPDTVQVLVLIILVQIS